MGQVEMKLVTHLKLLRQVEGNSVVLLCTLEALSWLDKGDHRCGHANLLVVNIVTRNVLVDFLHNNTESCVAAHNSSSNTGQPLS